MRLLSPLGSQITTNKVAGTIDTNIGDATELQWEFNEDCGRIDVSSPDDQ